MIAELYLAYKEKCHKLFLTKKTANKNFKINRRKYTLQLQNEFVLLKNELRRYHVQYNFKNFLDHFKLKYN